MDWLLGFADGLSNEKIGDWRQGALRALHMPYGITFASEGDGPGGMNTLLLWHPETKTIVVAFVNIFGTWTEKEFVMDSLMPFIVDR